MTRQQIDRFFRVLAKELDEPARVILTGAAAGSLWGSVRPSVDIDFCIRPRRKGPKSWAKIEEAIHRATGLTGIHTNYAQDIDRWGAITLLDYSKQTLPYRRFGKLEVRLLEPAYWSIGKISRYLDPDVQDLVAVFRRQGVSPGRLIKIWARALKASPPSSACLQFRKQAENFLQVYSRRIWGRGFQPHQVLAQWEREVRP